MAQNPLNPHQRQIDSNSCRFLQVMKLANRHETLEAHSLFSVNVSTVQTVMSASKLLRLGYPYYVFCLFIANQVFLHRKKLMNRKTDGLKFKLNQIRTSIFRKIVIISLRLNIIGLQYGWHF